MSKQYPSPAEVRAFLTGETDASPTTQRPDDAVRAVADHVMDNVTPRQAAQGLSSYFAGAPGERSWFKDPENDDEDSNVIWLRAPSSGPIENLTGAEDRCPTCGLIGLCWCEDCEFCEYQKVRTG